MGFFRKDAEQPTPIANESGASSPTEKLGDEKHEVVMPTREVDAAEEQRLIRKLDRRIVPMMVSMTVVLRLYDTILTLVSSTGLDVSDEVSLHSRRTAVSSASNKNVFSFMDRVSIGNARLYGMEDELGMRNNDYLLAVSVLFVTYCVCCSLKTTNLPS
jgi:hypothetical protein